MPYCPECAFEYAEKYIICPECGVRLVDEPPAKADAAASSLDNSWVAVCSLNENLSRDMIADLLDSNNIPSIVTIAAFQPRGNGIGWMARRGPQGSGQEVVMVPREYKEEAKLMLSAILGDQFAAIDMRDN